MKNSYDTKTKNLTAGSVLLICSLLSVMLIAYYDEGTYQSFDGFWHFVFTAGFKDIAAILLYGGISTAIGLTVFFFLGKTKNYKEDFWAKIALSLISIPMSLATVIFLLVLFLSNTK